MKQNNGGFSLVEVVAAIAILGMFFTAACSSLVLGLRINEKSDQMLQEQLAVSSAVETLMAEGIDASKISSEDHKTYIADTISDQVTVSVTAATIEIVADDNSTTIETLPYYHVTVTCNKVTVTTFIREVAE